MEVHTQVGICYVMFIGKHKSYISYRETKLCKARQTQIA